MEIIAELVFEATQEGDCGLFFRPSSAGARSLAACLRSSMIRELTAQELLIINNALNEVSNGIALEGEFSTRMGCSLEEARQLLAAIYALVGQRNIE